jgi:hypothetical protein
MTDRRSMKPLRWLLLSATLVWSTPALADPIEPTAEPFDTIHLQNGVQHKGRVTEVVPGDHVTLVDERGMKVFPWAQVDRVEVSTMPIPPSPPPPTPEQPSSRASPPPQASSPSDEEPTTGPHARVHIETPKPVVLYRRPAGTSRWVHVCNTPCTANVPIGDSYRVQGSGMQTSSEFALNATGGDVVKLDVAPSSSSGTVSGGLLIAIGGLTSYVGLVGAGASNGSERGKNQGLIAAGIGAGLLAAGVILFVTSRTTSVSVSRESGTRPVEKPPEGASAARSLDAHVRAPLQWRSAEHDVAPRVSFPVLFEGSF